jgi:hypothetical protein
MYICLWSPAIKEAIALSALPSGDQNMLTSRHMLTNVDISNVIPVCAPADHVQTSVVSSPTSLAQRC